MYRFFIRFYNQTDAEVAKCIDELKAAQPLIQDHIVEPGKQGMNWHQMPSHEVYLLFADKATAEQAMVGNDVTRDIYLRYAAPGQSATFNQRAPGMPVFRS